MHKAYKFPQHQDLPTVLLVKVPRVHGYQEKNSVDKREINTLRLNMSSKQWWTKQIHMVPGELKGCGTVLIHKKEYITWVLKDLEVERKNVVVYKKAPSGATLFCTGALFFDRTVCLWHSLKALPRRYRWWKLMQWHPEIYSDTLADGNGICAWFVYIVYWHWYELLSVITMTGESLNNWCLLAPIKMKSWCRPCN